MTSPSPIPTNYFATVQNGQISGVVEATPAQELTPCQILLTKAEFEVIRALSLHSIYEVEALKCLLSIQKKVHALKPAKRSKRK